MKQMRFISLLIIIALFSQLTTQIELPPFPSISDLPYQAHSFNDVGYIRQLMRRGVKYFKLDVSMANKQSCTKNSDWNQSSKCYQTNQYAEQYCCLGMRGDTSGRNNFEYPFNTLDAFIDMVEKQIAEHSIPRILFFAINFQFDFQFSNELVENSLHRLAKLMEKYPRLHFGTGSDNFILEYDRICRTHMQQSAYQSQNQVAQPLLKLNQQACTDKRKFISSSRFFLQSGANDPSDPRDYYGRFRNFNTFYKNIIDRCNNGFPAWVKKHPEFPLIFWEPSDQKMIQLVIETFLSEKCRRHHGRDINGLAITSNIDPEVFQFYLKRVNQTSSLNPMVFYPNNEKVALQQANNFLSKIVINNSDFLILGQESQASIDKKNGVTLELIVLSQEPKVQKVYQVSKKQLPTANGTIKVVGGLNSLIIVQQPLQKSEEKTVIMTLMNGNLQKIVDTEINRYIDMCYFDGQYYILRQTANPTIFNVIKTADFIRTSIILSFSLTLSKAKSFQSFLVSQDSEGKLKYFVSGSIDGAVWVGEVRSDNIYKSGIIGFGSNSKLTLKDDGLLAITIENGQCNSGVEINNGDSPQCALHKFPQLKPMTSTKSTITLIQVTISNLIQYLEKQTNEPVTPCTQKFVHSKAFNGKNINVVDIWSRLFFVSNYVPISQQGMLNALFCAPSNFEKLSNNKKGLLGTIWSRGNVGGLQSKQNQQNLQILVSQE